MEVGHNVLVERMDEWLPKLSNGLRYSQPTYPVLIHGVPTSFDASHNSKDVNEQLISDNIDTITHPAALWSPKSLGGTHSQLHQKIHSSLVVHFSDPTITNACINRHIALNGELLPVVKFMRRPTHCFNCHHTGHFVHSCKYNRRCGLCAEDHNTRHCRSSRNTSPAGQFAPLKCALCSRPHVVSDDSCPVHKVAIDKHWVEVKNAGPYYQLPG